MKKWTSHAFRALWAYCFGYMHACRPAKYGPINFVIILNFKSKIVAADKNWPSWYQPIEPRQIYFF